MKTLQPKVDQGLDRETFIGLYREYYQILLRRFLAIINSKEVVEDILQEVFIKVWQKREQIQTGVSLKSYMYRIGHNLIMDYYRHSSVENRYMKKYAGCYHPNFIDEDKLFHEDSLSRLEKIISRLPPKRKKVFELCKLSGKSYGEVSSLLDISHYTISDHIVKANRFIKSELSK